jgi:hypothetical protein
MKFGPVAASSDEILCEIRRAAVPNVTFMPPARVEAARDGPFSTAQP